jgi:hypothetical protein
VNGGQIMLAAQHLLEQSQPIKPEMFEMGVNTQTPELVTIGVNTVAQQQAQASTSMSSTSIASRQIVMAKSVHSLASAADLGIDESGGGVRIGLPYPSNLRVEKMSEMSLLVRWDPPTAPISLNQSIEFDNLNNPAFDPNDQAVATIQSYNLYLNNELHSMINGNDECAAIIDGIDLNSVSPLFLCLTKISLFCQMFKFFSHCFIA